MSNLLINFLIIFYIIIAVSCIFEHNWVRLIYWIGAMLIVFASKGIK